MCRLHRQRIDTAMTKDSLSLSASARPMTVGCELIEVTLPFVLCSSTVAPASQPVASDACGRWNIRSVQLYERTCLSHPYLRMVQERSINTAVSILVVSNGIDVVIVVVRRLLQFNRSEQPQSNELADLFKFVASQPATHTCRPRSYAALSSHQRSEHSRYER